MSNFVADPKTGLPIGPVVEAKGAIYPTRNTLEGRHVRLELLDPARHGKALYEISHARLADELWLYMPTGPFESLDTHLAHMEQFAKQPGYLTYVICDAVTGAIQGQASYMRIDVENRSIEVGYILFSPDLQRTPAATESMYLMARHAFEDLNFRRYEWKCNDLNQPSKRAALRLGFSYEGLFRQAAIVKGRNRDTAWYSMLDGEWSHRKAGFERWLSPKNFSDGVQKLTLEQCRQS